MAPEKLVGRIASVSDIVEEHIQLSVVVKVGHNDRADGRGSSKGSACDVLQRRATPRFSLSGRTEHKIFCLSIIASHAEIRAAALQEESVWTHPISVDDVRLPVTVEVGQRHSPSVLVAVLHTFTI